MSYIPISAIAQQPVLCTNEHLSIGKGKYLMDLVHLLNVFLGVKSRHVDLVTRATGWKRFINTSWVPVLTNRQFGEYILFLFNCYSV